VTEKRYLQRKLDDSRARVRELTRRGDRSTAMACCGEIATRHPGWLVLSGFAGAFLVGRLILPRLPGAGAVRATGRFVTGTASLLARRALVGYLLSDRR
jgi:hypothetical protein